jgi:hypothetical protein
MFKLRSALTCLFLVCFSSCSFTPRCPRCPRNRAGHRTVTLQIAGVAEDVMVQGALLGTAATGKTDLPVRDMP